jgi:hypothetical protein
MKGGRGLLLFPIEHCLYKELSKYISDSNADTSIESFVVSRELEI